MSEGTQVRRVFRAGSEHAMKMATQPKEQPNPSSPSSKQLPNEGDTKVNRNINQEVLVLQSTTGQNHRAAPKQPLANPRDGYFVLRSENGNASEFLTKPAIEKENIDFGSTATPSNQDSGTRNKTASFFQQIRNISFDRQPRANNGNTDHFYIPALFEALRVVSSGADEDAGIKYKQSRSSSQPANSQPTLSIRYLPHVTVSNSELKTALIKIAVVCQFLDAAFAEYFRLVLSHLQDTKTRLHRIRGQFSPSQADETIYVGPFGEYCEHINTILRDDKQARTERFRARATGDDVLPYLQDALEVPYWNMMADQFIKSKQHNNELTYETALSVINDKRRELKLRLQQIKRKWSQSVPQEIEDGILRRVSVLDALLAQTTDKYDSLEEQEVRALQRSPTSELGSASATAQMPQLDDRSDLEKALLLSLFFLFTAIAMVLFGMGFAGNWYAEPAGAIGSTSDPDFKWLIASTLLTIFGNIYAIVPLRKINRGSRANIVSQIFLYFSMALGIFSASVYPYWNKAWSSSLSFFCSFFAIGSVFISAQHTSETAIAVSQAIFKKKNE